MLQINGQRLLSHIQKLGTIGHDGPASRTRLALSDADKEGRDLVLAWMRELQLRIVIDQVGNITGLWETEENKDQAPVLTGSHIDTVIHAGPYDGCLGVLAGLEVIQTLQEQGSRPRRPLGVTVFMNEEGVRFQPDLAGSLAFAGGITPAQVYACIDKDGLRLGDELARIGYLGTAEATAIRPYAFLELHIEQGPVLDAAGIQIGIVEGIQGLHWQRVTIEGKANHAGTTPISLRHDAGLAAAKVNVYARTLAETYGGVATIGTLALKPNAVNVIPREAVFTIDLRHPDADKLAAVEQALDEFYTGLHQTDHVQISVEHMTAFDPVHFDDRLIQLVEDAAQKRGYSSRRLVSGAGQDAQMMARIFPTAMIFVPSIGGISHSPDEYTPDEDVCRGANVLLESLSVLATRA